MVEPAIVDREQFNNISRYNALMEVVRSRRTNREFVPAYEVPRERFEMILEAAPRLGIFTLGRPRSSVAGGESKSRWSTTSPSTASSTMPPAASSRPMIRLIHIAPSAWPTTPWIVS
jgi:hypothetical protein